MLIKSGSSGIDIIVGGKPALLNKGDTIETDEDVYFDDKKIEGDKVLISFTLDSLSEDEKDEYEDYTIFMTNRLTYVNTSISGDNTIDTMKENKRVISSMSWLVLGNYSILWYLIITLVITIITLIYILGGSIFKYGNMF